MSWIPRYGRLQRRSAVVATEAPGAPEQRSELVPIPEDWRSLPWNDLRALAAGLSHEDAPVKTKADAIACIEAELATGAAHAGTLEG